MQLFTHVLRQLRQVEKERCCSLTITVAQHQWRPVGLWTTALQRVDVQIVTCSMFVRVVYVQWAYEAAVTEWGREVQKSRQIDAEQCLSASL